MQYRESFTTKPGRTITIRSCLAADGEAVLEVFRLSHQETDFLLAYPDEVQMDAQQEGAFLQCKADNPCEVQLIAIDENQVVGIAGITQAGTRYKVAHRAELGVTVLKSFWHQGIGTALMNACIRCAREAGYSQLELTVVAENENAVAMYQKAGFRELGRNPKGFRTRTAGYQETIFMALDL